MANVKDKNRETFISIINEATESIKVVDSKKLLEALKKMKNELNNKFISNFNKKKSQSIDSIKEIIAIIDDLKYKLFIGYYSLELVENASARLKAIARKRYGKLSNAFLNNEKCGSTLHKFCEILEKSSNKLFAFNFNWEFLPPLQPKPPFSPNKPPLPPNKPPFPLSKQLTLSKNNKETFEENALLQENFKNLNNSFVNKCNALFQNFKCAFQKTISKSVSGPPQTKSKPVSNLSGSLMSSDSGTPHPTLINNSNFSTNAINLGNMLLQAIKIFQTNNASTIQNLKSQFQKYNIMEQKKFEASKKNSFYDYDKDNIKYYFEVTESKFCDHAELLKSYVQEKLEKLKKIINKK